jgi:hypothetical protein
MTQASRSITEAGNRSPDRIVMVSATPGKRPRDPRLDFFRGLAMFIIYIAHVPDDAWADYIPARFGFSSAAEMFVFCSGCASALAFGQVFVRRGWLMGSARIVLRVWQVYWAHIGLFLVLAGISIAATRLHLGNHDYVADLSLGLFASDGLSALLGLLTLTYDPDLLNILPMYIVLLASVPIVMALARLSRWLVFAGLLALWLTVQITHLNLPAGGAPGRMWFFDPFAWQLIFFIGFSFGMGFLPTPPFNHRRLLPLAAAIVVLSIPVTFWAFTDTFPLLARWRDVLVPNGIVATTELHALRYIHFLALAYVALSLVERRPSVLLASVFRPIVLVGQQALATFMASLALAWVVGMVLDTVGRGTPAIILANLAGMAALVAVARCVAWFKSAPWASAPKAAPVEPRSSAAVIAQPAE